MPATDDHPAVARQRRRLIQGMLGAAGSSLLWLTPHIARGASLLAVRVWPAPEYTRVTIEHDGPLSFRHFLLKDATPLRLVVDIEGLELTARFAEQIKKVDPADPFIARMRVGQFRPSVVRLVMELKQPIDPQVFALDPAGPYRNRLVLDLYPEGANDSLMALLRDPPQNAGAAPSDGEPAAQARNAIEGPDGASAPSATAQDASQPPAPAGEAAQAKAATPGSAGGEPAPQANAPATAEAGAKAGRRPDQSVRRLLTIAIDPGHGGEDPGAIGKRGTYEKTVTLSIGRQLAALIQEQSDYRVLMTRDADYFVPLGVRVEKARRVQADIFVSIHADAWVRSDARGSSVFALSLSGASSSAAAELARQQNEADLIGGVYHSVQDTTVRRVLLDLSTSAQISDSLRFGDAVLHEIERVNRLHRGFVEQAGFAVLKAPDIPSILVETAFISNPDEEARLRDTAYQRQMASAVFNGVRAYFAKNPPPARNPIG